MDKISAGADLLLRTDFNSKSSRAVRKGSSNSKVRESIETGQEAHRQIVKELKETRGAKTEVKIDLDNGATVRKDGLISAKNPTENDKGTTIIIKPDTPSGHRSGEKKRKFNAR